MSKLPDSIMELVTKVALSSDQTLEESTWEAQSHLDSARMGRDRKREHSSRIAHLELELACLRHIDQGGEWFVSGIDDRED